MQLTFFPREILSWGKEEDCGGLGDGFFSACTTATAAPAMIPATLSSSFFAVLPHNIFIGGGSSILSHCEFSPTPCMQG